MEKILENEILRVKIYPEMGGKIISFFHKGKIFEAAAQQRKSEEKSARKGFARYAYGFDDAFPNIDEEDFVWNNRKLHYPDHGEIWNARFLERECGQNFYKMVWESEKFAYRYEKEFRLVGNSLFIHYHIVNTGVEELPAIWTWHGLMRYEEGMEILFPKGTRRCRNVLEDKVLGAAGTVYPCRGSVYDFSKVPAAASGRAVKYYVEPEREKEIISKYFVRCGFFYPSSRIYCLLRYDLKKLPYLGVWITAGGFFWDYNCALEPTNGFYDGVGRAAANKRLPVLAPGESMDFDLEIALYDTPPMDWDKDGILE